MKRFLYEVLERWKTSADRRPLILRGARQVGKSYLVEHFGVSHFESVAVVNFEYESNIEPIFDTLNPVEIVQKLEKVVGHKITPGKTLLFLDEIQQVPRAILSLRYFREKLPDLHVIAAGSLLEFALHEEEFSFPVGRVEFLYMKPLSFKEFMLNRGKELLYNSLAEIQIQNGSDPAFHEQLIRHVKEYLLVGGMPAAVHTYLTTQSFLESQRIQNLILDTYRSDFGKYASKAEHKYLRKFFERAPLLVGKRFKYSKIDPDMRSRELKIAVEQLVWAGVIQQIHATSASGLPLQAQANEKKWKLLFLDVGLFQASHEVDMTTFWKDEITQINSGALAEQFVGQELIAYMNCYRESKIHFWERERKSSSAEVDYVISHGKHIFPIEVKAGKTGRLTSLRMFMKEKQSLFGIRISTLPLQYKSGILSVPFYLIEHLPRLIDELLRRR